MDNLCEFNEEQLKKALTHEVNDILQKNIFPVPKPTALKRILRIIQTLMWFTTRFGGFLTNSTNTKFAKRY